MATDELAPDAAHDDAVREGVLRLARPDERVRWDALMDELHYLGFKGFPGRGLRYVFQHGRKWLALIGWQVGAWKCQPRDRWVGWTPAMQMERLHLVANNARFLILPEGAGARNLGSRVLGLNLRRLSADWLEVHGHCLELAESFIDPTRFHGGVYDASNWTRVGRTRGYSRCTGGYTGARDVPKEMFVYPLNPDARARLCGAEEHPQWSATPYLPRCSGAELRSLHELFGEVPDPRCRRGLRHTLPAILSLYMLGRLCGWHGPVAVEELGKAMSQEDLEAIGARFDRKTERYIPASAATICRVLQHVDPDALQRVLLIWAQQWGIDIAAGDGLRARPVLAADGKRIRGANRNTPEGIRYETMTLVAHGCGEPLAIRVYREEGGELAAFKALLEDVDVRGHLITLDALHSTFEIEQRIVDRHGADYLFTIKRDCPDTFEALDEVDWKATATGTFKEDLDKAHGRIERRTIHVVSLLEGALTFRKAKQAFRIIRERTIVKTGERSVEVAYGITSLGAEHATPEQLLKWNRGHWVVENRNHLPRDVSMNEDASRAWANHAPSNNAILNNVALAIIRRTFPGANVPTAHRTFQMNPKMRLNAVCGVP